MSEIKFYSSEAQSTKSKNAKRITKKISHDVALAYRTRFGKMYSGLAEDVIKSRHFNRFHGKVQLIFTSPPFPLNRKKKYGNRRGDDYRNWLASFAPVFKKLLTPTGSIVIEMGNAWTPKRPVMSTLALETLMDFKKEGDLNLCQMFVAYNNARLPSPAQWVNIDRTRVKDSFTHIWWLSPSSTPKANNRNVSQPYSKAMRALLKTGRYNAGPRPSEHHIGIHSFLKDNGGSIPSNVLIAANTLSGDQYTSYCRLQKIPLQPSRMPKDIPDFFIRFLTEENDIVLDPFAGSNTTGAVAEMLKRRWISIEPQIDYVKGSKARFQSFIK